MPRGSQHHRQSRCSAWADARRRLAAALLDDARAGRSRRTAGQLGPHPGHGLWVRPRRQPHGDDRGRKRHLHRPSRQDPTDPHSSAHSTKSWTTYKRPQTPAQTSSIIDAQPRRTGHQTQTRCSRCRASSSKSAHRAGVPAGMTVVRELAVLAAACAPRRRAQLAASGAPGATEADLPRTRYRARRRRGRIEWSGCCRPTGLRRWSR